jgi:hypothetical protein
MPLARRVARMSRAVPVAVLVVLVTLLAVLWPAPAHAGSAPSWVAPLAGPVVVRRGFDPPATRWGAGHRGVDLAGRAGDVVRAAGPGEVTYAGVLAGRGVVVVRHGALRTTYEPVADPASVGTLVRAGTPVARLARGHPGPALPGEALLHWGLRGDTYLDPLLLLRRAPSRLLPVAPASPAPAPLGPRSLSAPVAPVAPVAPRVLGLPAAGPGPPDSPARRGPAPLVVSLGGGLALAAAYGTRISRAGRRASRAAGGPPWCASGRCGSRSRPGPGRSPPG